MFDHVLIDHSYTGSGMTLYQTLMTAIEFNNMLEKRNIMNSFTTVIKLICFAKELFFNSQLLPLNVPTQLNVSETSHKSIDCTEASGGLW